MLTSNSYNVASKLSEVATSIVQNYGSHFFSISSFLRALRSASSSSRWSFSMDPLRIKLAFYISSSLGVLWILTSNTSSSSWWALWDIISIDVLNSFSHTSHFCSVCLVLMCFFKVVGLSHLYSYISQLRTLGIFSTLKGFSFFTSVAQASGPNLKTELFLCLSWDFFFILSFLLVTFLLSSTLLETSLCSTNLAESIISFTSLYFDSTFFTLFSCWIILPDMATTVLSSSRTF